MPFFLHPMFIPAMYFGTFLAFMPFMAMMFPTPKKACVIIPFPTKKVLANN